MTNGALASQSLSLHATELLAGGQIDRLAFLLVNRGARSVTGSFNQNSLVRCIRLRIQMQVLLGLRCHASAQLSTNWCLILAVYERDLTAAVSIRTRCA